MPMRVLSLSMRSAPWEMGVLSRSKNQFDSAAVPLNSLDHNQSRMLLILRHPTHSTLFQQRP